MKAERIQSDLVTAMKERDEATTAVLRLLKSGLGNEKIKLGHELTDDEVLKVLQREAKQRRDSIEAYTQGGRVDLADAEKAELEIIVGYLPQQLSEEEVGKLVDQAIAETGAADVGQMGIVIGKVMAQASGQADGATVSRLVKARLSQPS